MRRLNLNDPEFTYEPDDPEGFRAGRFRLALGAKDTGASLYELPPRQAICPYHYEYGEEEWALVIAGHPTLRTPEGEHRLDPMDTVFFPKGAEGAHLLRNDTDEPVQVLMWSTIVHPSATAYPDSGKVGVWVEDRSENLMVERRHDVPYYHGEV
ncbi:MAG: cupin domain-containing protein [Solirubrobacteraceae bacterium]|nr:cupin domain-containing protein [Solirubrobacteraceae bacterium]